MNLPICYKYCGIGRYRLSLVSLQITGWLSAENFETSVWKPAEEIPLRVLQWFSQSSLCSIIRQNQPSFAFLSYYRLIITITLYSISFLKSEILLNSRATLLSLVAKKSKALWIARSTFALTILLMEGDKSGIWLLNLYKSFSCSAFKTIVFSLKSKNYNAFLTTSFKSAMILECVTNSKATALYHSLAIVPLANQKPRLLVDGIQTLSWDRPSLPAGGFSPLSPPPSPRSLCQLSTRPRPGRANSRWRPHYEFRFFFGHPTACVQAKYIISETNISKNIEWRTQIYLYSKKQNSIV